MNSWNKQWNLDWGSIKLSNRSIKNAALVISAIMMTSLVGCSASGKPLTNKEKSKFYQAKDFLESSSKDEGTKYDDVVLAYFKIDNDSDNAIQAIYNGVTAGLVSEQFKENCEQAVEYNKAMQEYSDNGDTWEIPHVYYSTNGNPKTYTEVDLSNSFSLIEQIERGFIGQWMYAIPEDDMQNVISAYYNNNLLLNFETGDYQIVDYKTDVYGNIDGQNDTSRKLSTEIDLDASDHIDSDDGTFMTSEEKERQEQLEAEDNTNMAGETVTSEDTTTYDDYTILSRNTFNNFIVYKIANPYSDSVGTFTVVLNDEEQVVGIDGSF